MSQSARSSRQRVIVPITSNQAQNSSLELQDYVARTGLKHDLRQLEKDKKRCAREWDREASKFKRRYTGLIEGSLQRRNGHLSSWEDADSQDVSDDSWLSTRLRAPETSRRARSCERLGTRSPRASPLLPLRTSSSQNRLDVGSCDCPGSRPQSGRSCVSARADSRRREEGGYLFTVKSDPNLGQITLVDPRLNSAGSSPGNSPRLTSSPPAKEKGLSPPGSEKVRTAESSCYSSRPSVSSRSPSPRLPSIEVSQSPERRDKSPSRCLGTVQKEVRASAVPASRTNSVRTKSKERISPSLVQNESKQVEKSPTVSPNATIVIYHSGEESKGTSIPTRSSSPWRQSHHIMANAAVIPQIIISTTDEDAVKSTDGGKTSQKASRRGSLTGASEAPEMSGKGVDFAVASLTAPIQPRSRSRSLPNVMDPGMVMALAEAASAASEKVESEEPDLLEVKGPGRQRSNSWCPGKPINLRGRRGSQSKDHVDSPRPIVQHEVDGGARRRRMSLSMERLLRDLSLGIEHKEFSSIPESGPVEEGLWKDLKKCRYLRKPVKKYQSSADPDEVEPIIKTTKR